MAAGPSGSYSITWAEMVGAETRIHLVERPEGGPFSSAQTVSAGGRNAAEPQVHSSADGRVFLTWLLQTAVGHQMIGTIREPGSDFTAPVELTDPSVPAFTPVLTGFASGQAMAGWVRRGRIEVVTSVPFRDPPGEEPEEEEPGKPEPGKPEPTQPGIATYDGKSLTFRLKCPARMKPRCRGTARAVTGTVRRSKVMTSAVDAKQKAGHWKPVKLTVRPAFRARVAKFAARPGKRTLIVRQVVRAPGLHGGKPIRVFHRYRVRAGS